MAYPFVADAAACENEIIKASDIDKNYSLYSACTGFKKVDGINYCGYYYALTSDGPEDIRVPMTETEGDDMWMAFYIGSTTAEPKLTGVPITLRTFATGDLKVSDSASRIGGVILAVLAAVAMIQ